MLIEQKSIFWRFSCFFFSVFFPLTSLLPYGNLFAKKTKYSRAFRIISFRSQGFYKIIFSFKGNNEKDFYPHFFRSTPPGYLIAKAVNVRVSLYM
jgi:hypothetical protein